MPSDEPLMIACEATMMNGPQLHIVIEFEFGEVEVDHVVMWVRLRDESYTFDAGRWYYWWNIRDFADGLATMRSELKGSCTLRDWDDETVLCLSMVDSGRGRIGVGGQFIQSVFQDDVAPKAAVNF